MHVLLSIATVTVPLCNTVPLAYSTCVGGTSYSLNIHLRQIA